jgi:gliding motility-associated-like protein
MRQTKKIVFVSICLLFMQLFCQKLWAVTVSATSISTPSICYNDGSLTMTGAGGTGPYIYTITSGPSNPNIIYPIVLPAGISLFGGLPAGTYTVQIKDALGNIGTVSATVGGHYQFPSLSFNTSALPNTIITTETGGLAPFSYAISSTGSNTGFGPFQSSDTFSHLCPGTYWIRVVDTCGNIYTDEVIFAVTITATISCINFSKGELSVTASGGTAPYTYSIDSMTNTTGNFSGLPSYFADSLVITDACGVRYTQYLAPPNLNIVQLCPYDSVLYASGISYPISPDTFTFICLNCLPPQSVTVPYSTPIAKLDSLFTNQPLGPAYDVMIISSACGGDTLPRKPVTLQKDIQLKIQWLSCRSFQASVTGPNGAPMVVDSFTLSAGVGRPSIQTNQTGLFIEEPDSTYLVTAYVGVTCADTPTSTVVIPHFNGGCFNLMKDSSCSSKWEYSVNATAPELFTLMDSTGHSFTSYNEPNFNANFYNLAPNSPYTLISDSGCTKQIETPPLRSTASAVVAYLVNITDSGWYQYAIYASNPYDTSSMLRYDTVCPIDTGRVYMNNTQVPYLFSNVALVCDSSSHYDTVHYQIYGGSPPYTVEIPGYDTMTIAGNTGIFPTRRAGSYTMLVYDVCGISRSLTFDVIDTCSGCPYGTVYLPNGSQYCAGDTVHLISQAVQAISYKWIINGQLYSTAADTSFLSAAGGNTIMLIVTSATGCADTAIVTTSDTCRGCPYPAISLSDTLYCVGDTVHLTSGSIGGVSYQWLVNGQLYSISADTILIATAGTTQVILRVTSATACTEMATIKINAISPDTINLGADTTYCGPFTRVLNANIGTATWSTGVSGPVITVSAPGTYSASATNICGTASDAITIAEKPIPLVTLGNDTSPCMGTTITLNAGNTGATYEWDNNSTAQTLMVTQTGIYSVSVTVNGCTGTDSIDISYIDAPVAFSVGDDTTFCHGGRLLLEAYQANTYSIWNTGSTNSFIYVSESGYYAVTDSNKCGIARDTIHVFVDDCSCRVQIPTAFSPNGDGKNDTYGGIAWCVPENYLLEIFDRWGQKMFTSTSISDKWDGTYEGHPQPLAVYAYYMKYTDPYTHIDYSQSGNVTLLR